MPQGMLGRKEPESVWEAEDRRSGPGKSSGCREAGEAAGTLPWRHQPRTARPGWVAIGKRTDPSRCSQKGKQEGKRKRIPM